MWTSLCQFNFFVNLFHSPCVWLFDIWHLFDNLTSFWQLDIFLTTWLFLGGLSLHLNHLIGSCMAISYQQFGTLSIGILLSNLISRQLMTYPRTLFGQFWHMSIFGNSRAVWVLLSKLGAFRKSIFLDEGVTGLQSVSVGFRWAGSWAIWWYHFWGVQHTWGVWQEFDCKGSHFPHICDSLEGSQHWLISSRISP